MAEASAPGKLLLTGEYAVLAGAPAVVAAVGVRAAARVLPAPPGQPFHVLEGSGAGVTRRFRLVAGRLQWLDEGNGGELVAALLEAWLERRPELGDAPPASLRVVTDDFRDPRLAAKLGLGSSAAALVALAGALARWQAPGEVPPPDALAELCWAAHRRFQGGQGSGVDVLAALHGGLLAVTPAAEGPPRAQPLSWPEGLQLVPVWSGQPASTPALVGRFEAWRRAAGEPALAGLQAAARDAARAWSAGMAAAVLAATREFAGCLAALDRSASLGIETPAHRVLAELSAAAGAVYKTSGAGGGDLGFALTDRAEVAARLRRDFAAAGFRVLELPLAAAGLQACD